MVTDADVAAPAVVGLALEVAAGADEAPAAFDPAAEVAAAELDPAAEVAAAEPGAEVAATPPAPDQS